MCNGTKKRYVYVKKWGAKSVHRLESQMTTSVYCEFGYIPRFIMRKLLDTTSWNLKDI